MFAVHSRVHVQVYHQVRFKEPLAEMSLYAFPEVTNQYFLLHLKKYISATFSQYQIIPQKMLYRFLFLFLVETAPTEIISIIKYCKIYIVWQSIAKLREFCSNILTMNLDVEIDGVRNLIENYRNIVDITLDM